jgi:hypothetical protein
LFDVGDAGDWTLSLIQMLLLLMMLLLSWHVLTCLIVSSSLRCILR